MSTPSVLVKAFILSDRITTDDADYDNDFTVESSVTRPSIAEIKTYTLTAISPEDFIAGLRDRGLFAVYSPLQDGNEYYDDLGSKFYNLYINCGNPIIEWLDSLEA